MTHASQRGVILLAVSISLAIVAAAAFMVAREGAMGAKAMMMDKERDDARLLAEAGINHARWVANTGGCSSMPSVGTTKTVAGTLPGIGSYSAVISRNALLPARIDISATGTTLIGAKATLGRTKIIPHETVSASMSVNPVGDTYITDGTPSSNFSTIKTMDIARNAKGESKGLLKFDPNATVKSASIIKATLVLKLKSGSAADASNVVVYRSEKDWVEKNATWISADTGTSWAMAGGDHTQGEASGTRSLDKDKYSIDVTPLLEGWYANGLQEVGIFLAGARGSVMDPVKFHTREEPGPDHKPSLNIDYKAACATLP